MEDVITIYDSDLIVELNNEKEEIMEEVQPVELPEDTPEKFTDGIKVYNDLMYTSIFNFHDMKKARELKDILMSKKIVALDIQSVMNPYPTHDNLYKPLEVCIGEIQVNDPSIVKHYEHFRIFNSIPLHDMMSSNVAHDNNYLYHHICGIPWSPNNIEMSRIYKSSSSIVYKHEEEFVHFINQVWHDYDYFIIRGTQKLDYLISVLQKNFNPKKILFYNKALNTQLPPNVNLDCPLHAKVCKKSYPYNDVAPRCAKKNFFMMVHNLDILKSLFEYM